MKPGLPNDRRLGITLVEVMIALAAVALIFLLLLPRLARSGPVPWVSCFNNLKFAGISFRQWTMDHNDKFPMALSVTNGGTLDHPLADEPWVHFRVLSNEISTPKALVCPGDLRAKEASDFAVDFGKGNLSYFVSLNAAKERPTLILLGDRNLVTNGAPVLSGLHTVRPREAHGWMKGIHDHRGNIGLADGSVQRMSSADLQQYLIDNPHTNRLAIP